MSKAAKQELENMNARAEQDLKNKTAFMLTGGFVKGYPKINRLWFMHMVDSLYDGKMTTDDILKACHLEDNEEGQHFIVVVKEVMKVKNMLITIGLSEEVLNGQLMVHGIKREDTIKISQPIESSNKNEDD